MRTVFICGTFDIMHNCHLVVFVCSYFQGRCQQNEKEIAEIVYRIDYFVTYMRKVSKVWEKSEIYIAVLIRMKNLIKYEKSIRYTLNSFEFLTAT